MSRPVLVVLAILVMPSVGTAQARSFLYSVWPDHRPDAPKAVAYADVGYGRDLFATLGPERLESRFGSQVRLGHRVTAIGQIGWAAGDTAVATRLRAEAEALVSVLAPSAPSVFAVGLGAASDYRRTGVILGRVVAGYRWTRTTMIANVRMECPIQTVALPTRRDRLDLITTAGMMRQLTSGFGLGVETVAEDLEGFVESDEAEGGAKLMVGPSIRLGSPATRWHVLMGAGPVLQLTHSTAANASSAPRELATHTGYVVRTSIGYRW
jgi:hypothetical protein